MAVTKFTLELWGAQGSVGSGWGGSTESDYPGKPGYAKYEIQADTSGTLKIHLGSKANGTSGGDGPWKGGNGANSGGTTTGGGGGASAIFYKDTTNTTYQWLGVVGGSASATVQYNRKFSIWNAWPGAPGVGYGQQKSIYMDYTTPQGNPSNGTNGEFFTSSLGDSVVIDRWMPGPGGGAEGGTSPTSSTPIFQAAAQNGDICGGAGNTIAQGSVAGYTNLSIRVLDSGSQDTSDGNGKAIVTTSDGKQFTYTISGTSVFEVPISTYYVPGKKGLFVKDGGEWKTANKIFVKDAGSWKEANNVFVKENGVWNKIFDSTLVVLDYRYLIELYGAAGADGTFTKGGQGGYTSFYLYPNSEKGNPFSFTLGTTGNNTTGGSGWATGGDGYGPSTRTSRIGGGGGGSSAVYSATNTYAVCGGGGGGGGGDNSSGSGGGGASPDNLSVNGSKGSDHDGGLGPGGNGGGGGLGKAGGGRGGDSGCGGSVNSPGAGGGGGGNIPSAGSSPTDTVSACNTSRCGGGGGGGGGLFTLDGNVDDYRMVFNSNSRGSYSGKNGFGRITVFGRELGSTGQWYQITSQDFYANGSFDPATIPTTAIAAPSIISPAPDSLLPNRTPTLQSSAFTPIVATTHKSTTWQISSNSVFSDIVWESVDNTTNLTSIQVPADTIKNGFFYCRVKYTGANGSVSAWSPTVGYNFPVVKPTIQFSSNTPPTLSTAAGNGYTFSVLATDTSNTGSTISYQWYWNGQVVAGATDRFWNISPFYWSDSGSSLYCQVTATNSGQSSTANSQTCTLTVSRSTVGDRIQVTDFNNQVGFEKGDCSASQGSWDGPPQGVQIGSVGGGQGKLGIKSFPDIKWYMRKANFPSGNGCSNGRGTKMDGTIRLSVYDSNGNYKWSAYDKEFQMGTDNNDGTDSYSQPGQESSFFTVDTQIDLDPDLSYSIWLQVKRGTVEKCDCPNMNNCQNIGYAGGQAIRQDYKNQLRWGTTAFAYKDDTRPTPTPPA